MSVSRNSIITKYNRFEGFEIIAKDVHIQADNESVELNVLKFNGTIQIICQYAEITEVTNMTNMTDVHADIWDGTNSVYLTKSPGAVFSGLTVGSFFTKDNVSSENYSFVVADEVRLLETASKGIAYPFTITGKNGVDNYIRFCFTTNTILDFKMSVWFRYRRINGGSLSFV